MVLIKLSFMQHDVLCRIESFLPDIFTIFYIFRLDYFRLLLLYCTGTMSRSLMKNPELINYVRSEVTSFE
jgi:hypothetical protein